MSEAEMRMYFYIIFQNLVNQGMHLWEICEKAFRDFGLKMFTEDARKVLDMMVTEGTISYGSHGVYYPLAKTPQRTLDSDWVV